MESVCVYLDLIGFSNFIEKDFKDGIELIGNYAKILDFSLNYSNTLKSMKSFLPFSDSIFILSDKPNLFIEEISLFLVNCFKFNSSEFEFPIDPKKPTQIAVKKIVNNREKKKMEVEEIKRNLFPTFFKGGISYGKVIPFKQKGYIDGKEVTQQNLTGLGIIKAVGLEKSGHGPRLFCDNLFTDRLDSKHKEKYVIEKNNVTEILWPIATFKDEETCKSGLETGFIDLFLPTFNLWKEHEKTIIGEIYLNFLKLIVISTLHYFSREDDHKEAVDFIKKYLSDNKMLHYWKSLSDIKSFI